MKSKIFNVAALFLLVAIVFSGCKKGPEDPTISLKSRDGRIVGTWKLVSSTQRNVWIDFNDGSSTTTTISSNSSYDGDLMSESDTTLINGTLFNDNASQYSYSLSLTIEKDGTYIMKETADGDQSEDHGYWTWVDSKKNKIGIAFDGYPVFLERLSNKEMTLMADDYSKDTQSNGNWDESTSSSRQNFEKE